MSNIQSSLRTYLLSKSDLTDLISTRLYYIKAIQDTELPYVVFYRVSGEDVYPILGKDGSTPVFSFMIISNTSMLEAVNISDAIRTNLHHLVDETMSGITVFRSMRINSRDFVLETDGYFQIVDDYRIVYER